MTTLKKPEVYKPLAIIIGFFGIQQFSGIFAMIAYATKFAVEAGVTIDPFLCTVLIGVARVLATVLVGYILDKWGRKPPSIFSGIGMTLCMFGLAAYLMVPALQSSEYLAGWLPTFLLIAYIFTSTLGFLTIPFTMLPELFPQRIRGLASGVTICFAYLMSFIVIKMYPTMLEVMGNEYVLIFYGTISLLGIFYVKFLVPETKGKTFQEIEELFKKKEPINDVENKP